MASQLEMEEVRVINIFGGPGTGKSTQAAGLFYRMKLEGMDVELVTEYAKDLVWDDRMSTMITRQEYIFAKQNIRLQRLEGKVKFVITDSPIVLGIVYANQLPEQDDATEALKHLIGATFNRYDNYNFYLRRGGEVPYQQAGRYQDEAGALDTGAQIKDLLDQENIPYTPLCVYKGDVTAGTMFDCVVEDVMEGLRVLV